MKRTLVLLTAACVAAGLTQAATAAAPKPKPVKVTMYAHGTNTLGEQDQTLFTGGIQPMDRKAPTGTTDKGKFIEAYLLGPNTDCTANGAFPNWAGGASGTIVGTATVTFYVQTNPGATVDVRLFADGDGNLCTNDTLGIHDYPGAVAEKNGLALPLTGGKVTVSMPVTARGKAAILHSSLVLEILPGSTAGLVGPQVTRVLYDSVASPTQVTFSCIPKTGKKTC